MRLQVFCIFLIGFLLSQNSFAQREVQVIRASSSIKIDGKLDEADWLIAPATQGFTEKSPEPNTPSSYQTEVKLLYDDEALYVAARMYDTNPEQILRQLSTRDDFWSINADKFVVYIDAISSKQGAFAFGVSASGVEFDASLTLGDADFNWDAAWSSQVNIDEQGWTAELQIPYSQLRFPNQDVQTWGINFLREVRRDREVSFWAAIDPSIDGEVQQYGQAVGIHGIKPSIRLNFLPFAVARVQHQSDGDPNTSDWKPQFSGGMDLKYGIGQSLTLDVSLIPDFSDVLSDDQQFNIGPFEIFFEERRPFFTEGTEILNRGDLFYSRRVGSQPIAFNKAYSGLDSAEYVASNPERSPLLNAIKLTGRNQKGFGIGVFNAITGPTEAVIQGPDGSRTVQTSPVSNYNVLVVDQLMPNNSFISFTNTNVMRFGKYNDANVSALTFRKRDKKNQYGVYASGAFSQQYVQSENSETYLDMGFAYYAGFEKASGNFRFSLTQDVKSNTYNPNDLGFLTRANNFTHTLSVGYRIFSPFWVYNNARANLLIDYAMLYKPMVHNQLFINLSAVGNSRKFMTTGFDLNLLPLPTHDYFEPRQSGMKFILPPSVELSGWFSSDYRKPFALDGNCGINRSYNGVWQRTAIYGSLTPIVRFSDRFNMNISNETVLRFNDVGFATFTDQGESIFGYRYRQDVINAISAQYLFTRNIAISLRVRHYWGLVDYSDYFVLQDDGTLGEYSGNVNRNTNFNAFNVDLFFRWRFAPGSELNLTWKNSVLSFGEVVDRNFVRNLGNVLDQDQLNSITLKVLYFVDYRQVEKTLKNI